MARIACGEMIKKEPAEHHSVTRFQNISLSDDGNYQIAAPTPNSPVSHNTCGKSIMQPQYHQPASQSRHTSQQPTQVPHCANRCSTAPEVDVSIGGAGAQEVYGAATPTSKTGAGPVSSPERLAGDCDRQSSLSQNAMQTLGQNSSRLIQVIRKLESLSLTALHHRSLPKWVVVGDQSAGKSSIIQAMCDLTLPRGTGTCTRCPHQITTMASKPDEAEWTCTVSLQMKYTITDADCAGKMSEYYGWQEQQQQDDCHFATITAKNDLEDTLRRAQLAILNPREDPRIFAEKVITLPARNQVEFSPNIVSLQIKAPGLLDLSFFDLPGAIAVHEDGERHLVDFVEKLIKNYVRPDGNARILLACSADQDVETSTAFRFLSECKATDRTVGVLTKPDLVQDTKFAYLERALSGKKFKVGYGWFVTRQPSQAQLNNASLSYDDARSLETNFFAQGRWADMPFLHRFGIPNLQAKVSQLLKEHILNELPDIIAPVENRFAVVTELLSRFPGKPRSAGLTVANEVNRVVNAINTRVAGGQGARQQNQFRADMKKAYAECRSQLKDVRPEVILKTPNAPLVYLLDDDDDDDDDDQDMPTETPTPTLSKLRKGNDGRPIVSTPYSRSKRGTPQTLRHVKSEARTPNAKLAKPVKWTLMRIKEELDFGSNSGIPGTVDPRVVDRVLIAESTAVWEVVISSLLTKVKDIVWHMLETTIQTELYNRMQTRLFEQVTEFIRAFTLRAFTKRTEVVMEIVAAELYKPITNSPFFSNAVANATKTLSEERELQRLEERETNDANELLRKGRQKQQQDRALPIDIWAREVNTMAVPLAYYDVASPRMMDSIVLSLEYGLLRPLETTLHEELYTRLHAGDDQYCTHLLEEDPAREQQRQNLLREKEKLSAALNELNALPQRAQI